MEQQEFEKIPEEKSRLMSKLSSIIYGISTIVRMMYNPFYAAYLIEQHKINLLYLKNRRILGKTFYIKNSKGKVLKSYKILETLYLETKSTMVIKYRERIFLKDGTVYEKVIKRWQDVKILENRLGRTL